MPTKWKTKIVIPVAFIVVILTFFIFVLRAPSDFPVSSLYTVEKGTGLNILTNNLADKDIIRSPFWFKVFSVLLGGTRGVIAGDYVLNGKQNTITLANRFARGNFELVPIKVTILEGLNIFEVSKLISQKFPKINEKSFLKLIEKDEGYLFPDTYFLLPNTSSETIIKALKDNFDKRIKSVEKEINNFGKPLADVIKMASIIEEEARTDESRQIVAGILWKRLSLGMPLQVDSSFKYINGKTTKDLTTDDLKINSPYNSYLYKGLPPTPISNPGLDAIKATVTSAKTDYLYFLSDKNGKMHYSRTYEGHLQNKELYLK